ncbi:unnamed protein product [Prorocentrum cordatum]|uniref:Uncharacterized protein n=1 Tax=Prorocentrum cordatum TaxID=2364126 RepID=A0ABN9WT65_9DINO|nr:unnamed protein product [Polarella glacialis]
MVLGRSVVGCIFVTPDEGVHVALIADYGLVTSAVAGEIPGLLAGGRTLRYSRSPLDRSRTTGASTLRRSSLAVQTRRTMTALSLVRCSRDDEAREADPNQIKL